MNTFSQKAPQLYNQYTDDDILQKYIKYFIPQNILSQIEGDLFQFGKKCGGEEYLRNNRDCEINLPKLDLYDAYGNEIYDLKTTYGWRFFKEETVKERLISIAYTERFGKFNRLYQFIKLYMFVGTSGLFSCPLSMTDGAAYLINIIKENYSDYLTEEMSNTYNRIISTNPQFFYTSGQWMTEKKGGSDVRGGTETKAEYQEKNIYKLYGLKWFTSAIDADVTFTLAKITDKSQKLEESKPPSLFFLKLRNNDKILNNIRPIRLKDKLGTKQVPTAELILDGTIAQLASPEGKGISLIMNLANITRLHNILTSVSFMRKVTAIVEDFSYKRIVFGKLLKEQPLHIMTVSRMKFLTEGCLLLTLDLGKLQGISEWERSKIMKADLLRLILPLAKLFTAKMSIHVCSEGMECLGGNGYMENSFIPNMLRDSLVLSIWEGTTNVLSLDFVRVYEQKKEAIDYFFSLVEKRISKLNGLSLMENLSNLLNHLKINFKSLISIKQNSRPISFTLTTLYIISLLAKFYGKDKSLVDENLLIFWNFELKKYFWDIELSNNFDLDKLKKTVFLSKPHYPKF